MFHAEEVSSKLILYYLLDYPTVENGRVRWWDIVPIDLERGILGRRDELGNVKELQIEKQELVITQELREKFLDKLQWTEVTTERGQKMIFPPNFGMGE